MRRRGFALLTVLWSLAGIAILVLMVTVAARDGMGTARNRGSAARAQWTAEGCVERARAAIDEVLRDAAEPDVLWRELDTLVAHSPLVRGCDIRLRPAGTTLDANAADEERLRLLLQAAGLAHEQGDSLARAIMDWRDADDEAREGGSERAWYRAHDRLAPRNAPFASASELSLVRGAEALVGDTLLGVEPGRVLLARAPAAVLATLPGFGAEAVARTIEARMQRRPVTLEGLAATLSPPEAARLARSYAALASVVTVTPDAWTLAARAVAGEPAVGVTVEVRLVLGGRRAGILARVVTLWS